MQVQFKVRYNGYRQPVISIFEVKAPNLVTDLEKKQLIEAFFKENIKQEGILQHYPYTILK